MKHKQLQWGLMLMMCCQLITMVRITILSSGASVQTMPILTPVSLDYERTYRAGHEPADLHLVMAAARQVDPTKVPKTDYAQFVADRLKMLELRNHRHALNVRLMDAGVKILEELTQEQWQFVQSQRDSIQAAHETKEMEALLQKWSN